MMHPDKGIKITHVIFDMDGLLLNTEDLYTEAFDMICRRYGKEYSWELKSQMMGKQSHEGAEMLVSTLSLPISGRQLLDDIEPLYEELFPKAVLLPGVDRLVRHLHRSNVPIAVATSSSKPSFDKKTRAHREFFDLFHHIVMGSSDPEVKEGKPHPDIFQVTSRRFTDSKSVSDPRTVLIFEDAPNGVQAAVAAGMKVIMVPHKSLPSEKYEHLGAEAVLQSLQDFDPAIWGLPPYE